MSAKHTPGKLIAETKQSDLETNDPRCSIGIVNGKILFTTTIVNAPNNAVRLCKCWNSHDALLDACKWLYGQWLAYADQRYLTPDEKKRKEQAKAAIKKAEEK